MASVNKVILIGHLGNDPEIKRFEGDNIVANISLATSESYKDRSGNKVDQTEWHSLELWGKQAEIAEQYLKKGSQVYVEGKIKSDTWTDEQGQNRKKVKIRVLSFTMLGGNKQENQTHDSAAPYSAPAAPANSHFNPPPSNKEALPSMDLPVDDELPF